MKFENKKWVLRVALAGALSLGVATVAKADSTAAAAPTFSVVAQELATQTFGTWAGAPAVQTTTNSTTGDTLGFSLQHVLVGSAYKIDAIDNLTVSSELVGGFTLLDAYDTHSLADLNTGLALKVGQFKIPFGANAYQSPDQLIRINYNTMDAVGPVGSFADGASQWDLGAELDQNWNDLLIQVAVVQNTGSNNQLGNKDWVGRAQWTASKNLTLGLSDYYQASSVNYVVNLVPVISNNTNFFGANASVSVDIFQLDLEAIWGNEGNKVGTNGAVSGNGYSAILSAKTNGFQPAVWYEFTNSNASNIPSTYNNMNTPDLGAGLNFDLAAKTRLAIDVDFTGYSTGTTAPAGDLLAVNTETVQLTESF